LEAPEDRRLFKTWHAVAALVGVLVLWTACGLFAWFVLGPERALGRGEFGDMFGAVNALFTGLAFAGVIITVLMQRDELALRRTELELTRDEMKEQRAQLEAQAVALYQQNFENTFFQLIRLLGEHSLATRTRKVGGEGVPAIQLLQRSVRQCAKAAGHDANAALEPIRAEFRRLGNHMTPYFNTLLETLELISRATSLDQTGYARIPRAQLTETERAVIFYYGAIFDGRHLKPLLERYHMLQDFSPELPAEQVMRTSYDVSAFSDSAH
jgi:hypothetical protein